MDAHSSADPSGKHGRALYQKCDATKWPDLSALFPACVQAFGSVDIVIPGAGVYEPHWSNFWHPPGCQNSKSGDPVQGTETEGLGHYATLDINLTHPIRLTQLAVQFWLSPSRQQDGLGASLENPKRVVHISSIAGQMPGFNTPLYQASKHGLSGFIRSLAQLDALGVRVNGVAPGLIRTPLWTEHPEKISMVGEMDSWVEPEEVAEAMRRCCVDDAVGGGVVLEVLKGRTREVGWRNDPGPEGPGAEVSNRAVGVKEVFGWLGDGQWGVEKGEGK